MKKTIYYPFLFIYFIATSCNSTYGSVSVQYSNYTINGYGTLGMSVMAQIKPYSDNNIQDMNDVVDLGSVEIEKELSNSELQSSVEKILAMMGKEKFPLHTEMTLLFNNKKGTNKSIDQEDWDKYFSIQAWL